MPTDAAKDHLRLAYIANACGERAEAEYQLEEFWKQAAERNDDLYRLQYFLAKAMFLMQYDEGTALAFFRRAVAIGCPGENSTPCLHAFFMPPFVAISPISEHAGKHGGNKSEKDNSQARIRITTFGFFEVLVDGNALAATKKIKKKPLDLLKIIIALGSTYIKRETIADYLWPEASGDASEKSFSVTLVRLRKLIGYDAIISREKIVSLNIDICSVDAETAEACMNQALQLSDREWSDGNLADLSQCMNALAAALSLYRGHFLISESQAPWVIPRRERLRAKFIRCIDLLGRLYEHDNRFDKAIECYRHGLEIDDVAEELYQRLMVCYDRTGRQSRGIELYRTCRMRLAETFGIKPSASTEAIYRKLLE